MSGDIVSKCPHCLEYVVVRPGEINCGVFRHGVMRRDFLQMDPHAPKSVCDSLYQKNLIYGCGRPLRYNRTTGDFEVSAYV